MSQPETPETGGTIFSSTVYDEKTNEFFEIRADENGIRVFPKDEDFSLKTFARFYEHIVENVDPYAEPNPSKSSASSRDATTTEPSDDQL